MQNRFKFRVWSHQQQKMFSWSDIITETHSLYNLFIDNKRLGKGLWTIMQSTGLKDKNGKLIYEGDIVRNITGTYTFTGTIKFGKYTVSNSINQGFYVEWQKKYEDLFRNDLLYWLEKEEGLMIIGNIYENGDLLNEQIP